MDYAPNREEDEMHHRVDWLKPTDRQIVSKIADNDGWVKPATLALNMEMTRRHIARRCKVLAEQGLLERFDEDTAGYRTTELGVQFLRDELDPADLMAADES